jgi:hypothetical protein
MGLVFAWRGRPEGLRVMEAGGLAMTAFLLVSSYAEAYHAIFLLPLLSTLPHPDRLFRGPVAWAGALLAFSPVFFLLTRAGAALGYGPGLATAAVSLGEILVLAAVSTAGYRARHGRDPGASILAA